MLPFENDLSQFCELQVGIPSDPIMELGVGDPRPESKKVLQTVQNGPFIQAADNVEMAKCCLSALWLFQDFLEESHRLSQSIHTSAGSYLHGIMHRREGDFSNAKYWFDKAGSLGMETTLEERLAADPGISKEHRSDLGGVFDPLKLVDAVSEHQKPEITSLMRVTFWELFCVFEFCFQRTGD